MPNKPEGVKKSAKQAMEERQVEMAAEFTCLQEAIRLEEEEECRQREEKMMKVEEKRRAAAERRREEEQKQRDIEESRRRVLELASLGHMGVSTVTSWSSTSEGPEKSCSFCMERKRDCTWTQASRSNRIRNCDMCRQLKAQCSGSVPPVSIDKGKKRERAEGTPSPRAKGKKCQRSPAETDDNVEEGRWAEYDNEAWVAAANDIVVALAWTNELLEQMRSGFRVEAAEEPEETEVEVEGGGGAGVSGGDMETDDL
ncbi:uncharacterized protein EDB91DRAFT_1257094 [Suillus paluster]|uniref:uncharacterized protein n=1 Tax=Suillus paluster TaxID=48578 RepID=UPI001B878106|nr:uncharacterized protein EDB91DRAFT_1257094 [Suillus paluster]KAG1720200.1 hypothetical protein EDB91DRAFT_1257094 [Suillus paluster]